MDRVFHVPLYARVFEEYHDRQLDHSWRPPGEDRFSDDREQWNTLYYGVKRRLKAVVHALSRMETEIVENADDIQSLLKEVLPHNVSQDLSIMYIMIDCFRAMEGIHIRSYGTIDSILDMKLHTEDIESFRQFTRSKIDVVSKWRSYNNTTTDKRYLLSKSLLGNVFSEGLVFNTMFSIFSIPKKNGFLKTTCETNDEVLSDENIHTQGFIAIYNTLTKLGYIPRLSQDEIATMAEDFVSIDDVCAEWLLGNLDTNEKEYFNVMNEKNAKIYTRIVTNYVLKSLGYEAIYPYTKENNPYPLINQSLINTLGFFFDKTVVEYGTKTDHQYESDSDFSDDDL